MAWIFRLSATAAGLLALAGLSANASEASPTDIRVELSNFRFTPATIRIPLDKPVRLTVVNRAGGGHNFVARDFFAAATISADDRSKIANGGIEIPGNGSVTIRLTIAKPGEYSVKCTHFLHKSFGMKGALVVS